MGDIENKGGFGRFLWATKDRLLVPAATGAVVAFVWYCSWSQTTVASAERGVFQPLPEARAIANHFQQQNAAAQARVSVDE
ncbi:MAG TPA: hypothetical protein VIL86_02820 [Tepidisphaeraceae bacterium]